MARDPESSLRASRLVCGILLILVGGLVLSDRVFGLDLEPLFSFWPLAFVALGVLKVVAPRRPRSRRFGAFLIVLGTWLQAVEFDWIDAESTWPVLIIAWGILLVVSALGVRRGPLGVAESGRG